MSNTPRTDAHRSKSRFASEDISELLRECDGLERELAEAYEALRIAEKWTQAAEGVSILYWISGWSGTEQQDLALLREAFKRAGIKDE